MSGYRIVPEYHLTPETRGPDGKPQPAIVFQYAVRRSTGELVYRTYTMPEARQIVANLSPEPIRGRA